MPSLRKRLSQLAKCAVFRVARSYPLFTPDEVEVLAGRSGKCVTIGDEGA